MSLLLWCVLCAGWRETATRCLLCVIRWRSQVRINILDPVWNCFSRLVSGLTGLCDTFITCSFSLALQLSQHASLFLCLYSVVVATAFCYLGNPATAWLFMSAPSFYFQASLPYRPTSSLKNSTSGCSTNQQEDGLLMFMFSFSCRSSFSDPVPVHRR